MWSRKRARYLRKFRHTRLGRWLIVYWQRTWFRVLCWLTVGLLLVGVVVTIFFLLFPQSDSDFSRGVLAINTDKSVYLTGEAVLFQMVSLDKNGDTRCDSDLQIEISEPKKWRKSIVSTQQQQIQQLPTCSSDNIVTNEPDYIARFTVTTPGTYRLTLKNLDTDKSVKSSFEVVESTPAVAIERTGATRLNPFKSDRYPMILRLVAHKDFKGKLVETVPHDFDFKWYGPAKILKTENKQQLTWDVDLQAGETKEYVYEYAAPQKSPDFIKIGVAQIFVNNSKTFEESRNWQIVASK